MKNVIIGIIGGFVLIYVTVISLSIYSRNVRENELNCTVSAVMKQTLKRNDEQECDLHQLNRKTDKEVEEQITQEIIQRLSSDSEVYVDVKVCDMEKGILSISVTETFSYPNGKTGTVQTDKTIIMDRKVPKMSMVKENDKEKEEKESKGPEDKKNSKDKKNSEENIKGLEKAQIEKQKSEKENEKTAESNTIWEHPEEFYDKYGNTLVFHAANRSNGTIYCATKGNVSTHRYYLLGWKVEVRSCENNETVQTLFFQLGGKYMRLLKTSYDADYSNEYLLYGLSTVNLKAKLNKNAQELLNQGKGQIIFQGCIAPVDGGIVAGTMDKNGNFTGKVCTDVEDIHQSKFWSESEKQQLVEYYEREAKNLLHAVKLSAGEGIDSVIGTGSYLHGISAEIDANIQAGYEFQYWWGKDIRQQKNFSVQVEEDMEWTAIAIRNQMLVIQVPDIRIENSGEMRFISREYFEDNDHELVAHKHGGLSEDSCWIVYPEYRELLREVLR